MLRLLRVLVGALALIGTAQGATTATTLSVSANGNATASVSAGTVVTLTATVAAGATPVTPGHIQFCEATSTYCTGTHLIGSAQLTSSGSAVYKFVPGPGTHSYKAVFAGTNLYAGSASTPAPLVVSGGPSGVSKVGTQASGGQGDYTLLGTVAPAGMVSPAGQVSFLDTSNANYALGAATLGPTGASNPSFLQSYSYQFPLGTGAEAGQVAAGDFNNDGHPDILFASTELGAVYTLLGNGDGTFTTLSFPFAVQSVEAPIVADFNGDGKLDFVLRTKKGLAVYLGNGDGTFTAGIALSIAPLPTFTVADLNNDGIPDLLVGNGASLQAYLGDGTGGFAAPKLAFFGIQASIFTLTADFNGDGNTDVLLVSAFGVPQVILGNGDGTFRSGPANPFSSLGVGVSAGTVGDLNDDGKPDLVIAEDFASHPPIVLLGNGDGTFTVLPSDSQLISASNAVTLADFNGDGILDVVFPNLYGGQTNVYIGKGDGTFTPDIYSPGLAYFTSESLAAADFNGDGQADIAEVFQGDYDQLVVLLAQPASTSAGYANNISPVGTGYHYVEAFYAGDANTPAGNSQTIPLLAEQVQPNLSLTALPASGSLQGQTVTLTASLDQFLAQNHSASGTVTFTSNGNTVGSGTVSGGVATTTVTSLAVGTNTLTAVYGGDTNFAGSTSADLPYTVKPNASSAGTSLVEPVGTTSALQVATVTISAAGTLGAIAVLTQGAANLDFNSVQGGIVNGTSPCAPGTTYAVGQTCSVFFTFKPTHPGPRYGGITLTTTSGALLGNAYISGTGTGPQVNWRPGQQLALGTGLSSPNGVAVDGNGNAYVAEYGKVVEIAPSGAMTTFPITTGDLTDVAVDGSGNVFVVNQLNGYGAVVNEILAVNGSIPATPVIRTIAAGFITLHGIAVDGNGDLFLTQLYSTGTDCAIYEIPSVNGNIPAAPNVLTLATSFGASTCGPSGVAVDASGNLFVSDGFANSVYELLAVNGSIPATPTIRTLANGFNSPFNVALDAAGDVFVADFSNSAVKEIVAVNGSIPATNPTILKLGSGFVLPTGVAVDGSGNVFVSDIGLTQVIKLDFADPPSLTFAATAVGQTSTDSPQTVTMKNNGNENLSFSVPGLGVNPSITPGFTIGVGSTCPQLTTASSAVALAAGASCTDLVNFTPVAQGLDNGKLLTTDNDLNVADATQVIPLSGTGTPSPTATTLSVAPNPAVYGSPVTMSAVISPSGAVPTGFVEFYDNGVSLGLAAVASAAEAIFNSAALPLGLNAITCTYLGDATHSPSTCNAVQVTITPPPTQTIAFPQPATPAYVATSVMLTATGGASGTPVVFSVVSGPAMVSGTNGSTLTYTGPGTVVVEADQAAGGGYPAAAPVRMTMAAFVLTEPVGSASSAISTLVTFQAAGTLAAIRSSTQGVAGLDFSLASGGTCSQSATYTAGQTCVLEFGFNPTHPGQRFGGAVFTTASGAVLATSYFYGVGTGPQVTFSPGTQTALPGTPVQPGGIAVDGTGNVFVATYGTGLYEIPVSGLPHQIGSLADCDDVTVDGVGNVFVVSSHTTLSEVLAVNGTIPAAPTIVTISTQFGNTTGVKVDGLGNVYVTSVASGGTGAGIFKVIAVDGSIPASPTIQTLSTAFQGATGVAIDANGNLYVTDELQSGVFEVMAVNGSIPASATILPLATGLNLPSNVTLDAAGNVFVSDYGDGDVKEILAVNGSIPAANPTMVSLGTGLVMPQGIFVDQSGNIFVADAGLSYAVKLDFADAPTLSFKPTTVGQTGSDSPQTVTLTNDGNTPLVFAATQGGVTPTITTGFTIGAASTCPQVVSPATGQLAEGASCTDFVSFTPVNPGTISGQLVSTDNALNQPLSSQTVPLNGVALNLTVPTITFSVPNQTLGTPPFPVAAVSNSPGAITYSVVSGPATVAGSTVTLTGVGTVTLLASQAATGIYAAGTATATFNVAKEPQTIAFAPLASPLPVGTVTLAATATSGLPVSFSVVSGPATVSGAVLTLTGTGTVVVAANQAGNGQYAAAPTVTQTVLVYPQPTVGLAAAPNPVFLNNPITLTATLSVAGPAPSGTVTFLDGTNPIGTATLTGQTATIAVSTLSLGTHSITASYGGNAIYARAVSPAVPVVVEDFQLTLSNPNVTIFHGGTATFLLSVTAPNGVGMASTVTLAATGVPAGSQVTFTPAAVPTGSGTTPVTLVIQTPNYPTGPWQAGSLRGESAGGTALAALLLTGGLLLPWRSGRRRRLLGTVAFACLVAGLATGLVTGLSGCGSGWRTQVWTIDVTATSGQLSHRVTGILTSECRDGQAACPVVAP